MISNSKTFCSQPWTTLNIDQNGRVKPCLSSHEYGQTLGNINENTIQEIIAGPKLAELKETIAQGQWHALCQGCRRVEEGGAQSARNTKKVTDSTLDNINNNIDYFQLTDLTVNWSNLCNLTCTYCNPLASTAWQAATHIPINLIKNQHNDLIELVSAHRNSITGLTLGGGEPLLQKGVVEFLKQFRSEQTQVMITTNLSVNLTTNEVYQELKHWPKVSWQVSFDNTNSAKFEYVRSGSAWELFTANIQQLKQDGQHVVAHPAYSIYSALDLVEYYKFCSEQNLDIFWCDLKHPYALDVRRSPDSIRHQAQQVIDCVLSLYSNSDYELKFNLSRLADYRQQLNSRVVDGANVNSELDPVKWHQEQELILKQRHSFIELWPEYANIY